MKRLTLLAIIAFILVGCKQSDEGIVVKEVKQCRDASTGQFVACP
jgi:uncharacterized protein YcfL